MSEDPGAGLVGTTLAGRYRVLRKLGEGAMGAVYLAEHVHMGRQDAIKVLRDALASDREALARFERGARNVSKITHPNVCAIYDFAEAAEGLRFVAMEYIGGPTLKHVIEREGALPMERAVDIAAQVAAALDAAHEAGIVHRDLKPGNIMLLEGKGGRDIVKVVDFDIAKGSEGGEEVTRLGFVIGTPEYMSPEQLMGEELDGRSDVYSAALVLFRMLTGALPFHAADTQDMMIARLTSTPLRLDQAAPGKAFPEALQHAIERALQRKAADRQPDAETFGREIRAALSGAPGVAPVTVPPTRTAVATPVPGTAEIAAPRTASTGGGNRQRLLWYGGMAAVAVTAVIVGVLISGQDPAPINNIEPFGNTVTNGDSGEIRPDTGGGGENVDSTPTPTPPPPPPPPPPPLTIEASAVSGILLDFNERVLAESPPARTQLIGIRDTLEVIWRQTTNPGQRRVTARLYAYVYLHLGQRDQCDRWIQELRDAGGDATEINLLVTRCGGQQP